MNAPSFDALPVARASAPSNRSKTPPKTTSRPARSQLCEAAAMAAMIAMPKPIRVRALGVRPTLPIATAIGVAMPRTRARRFGRDERAHEAACSRPRRRRGRGWPRLARGELLERLGDEAVDGLAAAGAAPRRARPRGAARGATRRAAATARPGSMSSVTVASASARRAHDAEPVHVGEGLVDEPQLAQLVGLVDDGRDRAADAGRGGGHGEVGLRSGTVASTTVYINGR